MDRGIKQRLKKKKAKAKKLTTSRPQNAKKQFGRDFDGYKNYKLQNKSPYEVPRTAKLLPKEKKHRRNLKSLNAFTIQSQGMGIHKMSAGSPESGPRRGLRSRGLGSKLRAQKTRSKTYTESQLIKFRQQSQLAIREQEAHGQSGEKAVNLELQMPELGESHFREMKRQVSPGMSRPTSPEQTDYSNFVSISSRNFNNPTGQTNESETSQKRELKGLKQKPTRRRKKPQHFRNQSHQLGNNFSGLHSIRNIHRNKKSPILGHMSKSNFIHPNSMVSPLTKFPKKTLGLRGHKGGNATGMGFAKKKNSFLRHKKNMSSNFTASVKHKRGIPFSFAEGDPDFGSEFRRKQNVAAVREVMASGEGEKKTQSIGFSQSFNTNLSNSQTQKTREALKISQTPTKRSQKRNTHHIDLARSQNSRLMGRLANPNLNLRAGLTKPGKLFSLSHNKRLQKLDPSLRNKTDNPKDARRKMNRTVGQGAGLDMLRLRQYNTNSSIQEMERNTAGKANHENPNTRSGRQMDHFVDFDNIRERRDIEEQINMKRKEDTNIVDSKHLIDLTRRVKQNKKRQKEKRKRKKLEEQTGQEVVKISKTNLRQSGYHSQRVDWQSLKTKNKDDFQSYREGYGPKPQRRMDPLELVDYIGKRGQNKKKSNGDVGLREFEASRGMSRGGSPRGDRKRLKQKKWAKSSLRSERGLIRLGVGPSHREVQSQVGSVYSEHRGSHHLGTGAGFESENTNIYQGKNQFAHKARKSLLENQREGKVLLRDSEGREYWVPLSVLAGQHPEPSQPAAKIKSQRDIGNSNRDIGNSPTDKWNTRKIPHGLETEIQMEDSVASLKEQIMKEAREEGLPNNPAVESLNINKEVLPANCKNSPTHLQNSQLSGHRPAQKRFEIFTEEGTKEQSGKHPRAGLMGIYGREPKGKRKMRMKQGQIKKMKQMKKEEEMLNRANEKAGRLEAKLNDLRDERETLKERENAKYMESLRSWELDSFAREGWGQSENHGNGMATFGGRNPDLDNHHHNSNHIENPYEEGMQDGDGDLKNLNIDFGEGRKMADNLGKLRDDSFGKIGKQAKKEFVLDLQTEEKKRQVDVSREPSPLRGQEGLLEELLSEGEESKLKARKSLKPDASPLRNKQKYIRVSGKETSGKKFEIFGSESNVDPSESLKSISSVKSAKRRQNQADTVITYSNHNQGKKARVFVLMGDDDDSDEPVDVEVPKQPNVSSRYDSEKLNTNNAMMLKGFQGQMAMNLELNMDLDHHTALNQDNKPNEIERNIEIEPVFDSGKETDLMESQEIQDTNVVVKEMGDNLLYKERRRELRESEGNLYSGKVNVSSKKKINQSNMSGRKKSVKDGDRLFESRVSKDGRRRIELGRDRMKSNRVLQDLKRFSKEIEIPMLGVRAKQRKPNVIRRKRNRHKKNAHSEHIPDAYTEFVQKLGAPIHDHLKINNMTPALSRKGSSDVDGNSDGSRESMTGFGRDRLMDNDNVINVRKAKSKQTQGEGKRQPISRRGSTRKIQKSDVHASQSRDQNVKQEKGWHRGNTAGSENRDLRVEPGFKQKRVFEDYQQEDYSGLFGGVEGSGGFSHRQEVSDIEEPELQEPEMVFRKKKWSEHGETTEKVLVTSDASPDQADQTPHDVQAREGLDKHGTPDFGMKSKMGDPKKVFLEDHDQNKYGSSKASNNAAKQTPQRVKVKKRKRRINFIDLEENQRRNEADIGSVSSRGQGKTGGVVPSLPHQNRERLKLIERRRLREIQAFKRKKAQRPEEANYQRSKTKDKSAKINSNYQAIPANPQKITAGNPNMVQSRTKNVNHKSCKSSSSPREDASSKGQSNMAPNSIVNSFGNHTPAQRSSRSNRISITIISHQSSRNSEINNIRINHSMKNSKEGKSIQNSQRESGNVFRIDSPDAGNGETGPNRRVQIDVRASKTGVQGVGVEVDSNNFTLGNQQLERQLGQPEIEETGIGDTHCINVNIPAINSSFEESASFGNSEESNQTPITENTFGQGMAKVLEENRPPVSSFRHSFGIPDPRIINQNEILPEAENHKETEQQTVDIQIQDMREDFEPQNIEDNGLVKEAEQTVEKTKKQIVEISNAEQESDKGGLEEIGLVSHERDTQPRNVDIQERNDKIEHSKPKQRKNEAPKPAKKSNGFFYERDSIVKGSNSDNSIGGKKKSSELSRKREPRDMIIRARLREGIRGNFNSPIRKKRHPAGKLSKAPRHTQKTTHMVPLKAPKDNYHEKRKKRDLRGKTKERGGTRTRAKKRGDHLKNSIMLEMGRQKIRSEMKLYENKSSVLRMEKSRVRSRKTSPAGKKGGSKSRAAKRPRREVQKRTPEKGRDHDRTKTKSKGKTRKMDHNAHRRKKSKSKIDLSESRVRKAGRKDSSANSKRKSHRSQKGTRVGNLKQANRQSRHGTNPNPSRGTSQRIDRRDTNRGNPTSRAERGQMNSEERRQHKRELTRRRQATAMSQKKRILEMKILKYSERNESLNTNLEFYGVRELLGQGSYAKVYLGESVLCGRKVAIKKYEKSGLKKKSSAERVFTEIEILRKMHHPNIIQFLEIFENQMYIFIIMEYGDGGDLLNHLKNSGRFSEESYRNIMQQIIDGLSYIHAKGILHRDIKLDNIILTSDRKVKICDFGISRRMEPNTSVYEHIGTPAYLAPEIIMEEGYSGFAADIWSLGVMSFMAMTGNVPFKGSTIDELHEAILKKSVTFPARPQLSAKMKRAIRGMLDKDPERRLGLTQVCKILGLTVPLAHRPAPRFAEPAVVTKIKSFGFTESYITRSLRRDHINHVTALYKLLLD